MVPGPKNVTLENRTGASKAVYGNFTQDMEPGKHYSFFLYDTLSGDIGVKVLRLNDNLTLPPADKASIRFLNLAPNGGDMDVTFVRGTQFDSSSTATQKLAFIVIDSVTIISQSYVGNSPNVSALSEFKTSITGVTGNPVGKAPALASLPSFFQNNRYIIRLKRSGTQTVLFTSAVSTLLPGRIYTVFARGTAKGQALGISIIQHF
jgi:hypothetical protein